MLQHRGRLHQGPTGTAEFVGEVDGDRRGQLVEQAGPGSEPGLALLGNDRLLGLREQVRPAEPEVVEVMAAEVEPGIRQHGGDVVIVSGGPFEVDEDQLGADGGRALLGCCHCGAARRVVGGRREREHGVIAGARHQVLELGQRAHRRCQFARVEGADASPQRHELVGKGVGAIEEIGRCRTVGQDRVDVPRHIGRREVVIDHARVGLALVDGHAGESAPSSA